MIAEYTRIWGPATLTGLATYVAAHGYRLLQPETTESNPNLYNDRIRNRLRSDIACYRFLEGPVERFAKTNLCQRLSSGKLQKAIQQGGTDLPLTACQMCAVIVIRSTLLLLFAAACISGLYGIQAGLTVGAITVLIAWHLQISEIVNAAQAIRKEFESGFPFAIDLAGIIMQAGADVSSAIEVVAREWDQSAVGGQFGKIQKDLRDGQCLADALTGLKHRIQSTAVAELVTAIQKSEELGTPLSNVFLNQSQQMRIKKSQAVESASGEAEVRISFPTMLIMIACMITICAPFLFGVAYSN